MLCFLRLCEFFLNYFQFYFIDSQLVTIYFKIILLLFGYCYCINQKVFISLTHQTKQKRLIP